MKWPLIILAISSFTLHFILYTGCKKNESTPVVVSPKKWQVVLNRDHSSLSSIFFVQPSTGYAVGSLVDEGGSFQHGLILKTSDKGKTWTTFSPDTLADLFSVFFTDSVTGYAAGTNCILKTSNGGDEWHTILKDSQIHINSLYFPDSHTGFAVGLSGEILRTTDAGQHWEYLYTGTHCQLRSVYFTDINNGYVVGYKNENPDLYGILLKTRNGGDNWDSVSLPAGFLPENVCFSHPQTGYITGSSLILKTTDGGNVWEVNYSYPYNSLCAVSFVRNSPRGFAVGQGGVILKTVDAGLNWSQVESATTSLLQSVFMVNHDLAFAATFDALTKSSALLRWE